ncbi:MAG: Cell division protein FtsK [Polyangiaceae bacterium]|nr:Cell division protein FtsK [Polyangiaceae bacterium]
MLFSLSALTSAASRPSSRPIAPAPSGAATREDSGLIDLKALTAAATKSETAAPAIPAAPLISPLAASPLGIAAPLGTHGGMGSPAMDLGGAPSKSKNGLYIGGGIAVAALAAVAIAFLLKPAPPPPAPTPVAPPPVAAAPTTPTPTPTAEVTATPPSTGTAETDEAPKPGTKPVAGTGVKRPSGGTGVKKPATDSKPAVEDKPATAAPKPKKNPCGCAPGDLQCAMRCAAG